QFALDRDPDLIHFYLPVLFRSLGRVALLRVVEDQDPIAARPPGRGDEFARPRVRILADVAPRPFAGVIPPGLDLLARNLVHVNADRAALRQVRDEEAVVHGPGGLDVVGPVPLARGKDGLVRDELVPGPQLEQPAHETDLAGALVGHRLA